MTDLEPTESDALPPGPTAADAAWQQRLLPFMIRMLVVLTALFFVASSVQVYLVQKHMQEAHEPDLKTALGLLEVSAQSTPQDRLNTVRWGTIALLESHALQSRYHQVSIAMMSRLYIIFLGFVTGMVLSLVGATFILGKLREAQSHVQAGTPAWSVSLTTASPGLLLAMFGTVLMVVTVLARVDFEVRDTSLYIQPAAFGQAASIEAPPKPRGEILKSLEGEEKKK